MDRKNIGIIADEETLTGFLIAGVENVRSDPNLIKVTEYTSEEDIKMHFDHLTNRDDIALILICDYAAELIKDDIKKYDKPIPSLLIIGSKVYRFMKNDTSQLSETYNPLEIRFKQADINFFSDYDNDILLDICNASNYLEYTYLLELCCKLIAAKLKTKNAKDLRSFVGLECDMDSEQLEEIDKEFGWMSSDE